MTAWQGKRYGAHRVYRETKIYLEVLNMYKLLICIYMGSFVVLFASVLTVNTDILSVIGGFSAGYTYITN